MKTRSTISFSSKLNNHINVYINKNIEHYCIEKIANRINPNRYDLRSKLWHIIAREIILRHSDFIFE